MKLAYLLLLSITIQSSIIAQLAIGEWDSHLAQVDGKWVTQSTDEIIYSNGAALIYIDKQDLSPRFVDKVSGLSDVSISRLAYDKINDQLIVAYSNSNLDIIQGSTVNNLPYIKENTNIIGDRQINDIYIDSNGKYAYLSTAFGIIQLNLLNLEFASTIFTNLKVNSMAEANGKLYAATEDGLYVVDNSADINIADFGQWKLLGEAEGLPQLYEAQQVIAYKGQAYMATNSTLYKSDNGAFQALHSINANADEIRFLSAEASKLVVGVRGVTNNNSRVLLFDENDDYIVGGASCINRVRYGIEDEQGRMWYADDWRAIRHTDSYSSGCHKVEYNSPRNDELSDIKTKNGEVFVASGGATDSYTYKFTRNGVYRYKDSDWINYNENTVSELSGLNNHFRVLPDPNEDKFYIGLYYDGLVIMDEANDAITIYNKDNSLLQGAEGDELRTRISGLALDDQGNLWMSNHSAPKPLVVLTAEGNWHSFALPTDNQVSNIIIDQQGYKWMVLTGFGGGIVVYDDGGTIADPTDDRSRYISPSNSELPTSVVRTLKMDLDGNVWAGTAEGAVVFECGSSVFDQEVCRGSHRKVTVDGIVAFLLETEDVFAIEVDGANRKWFGSQNGIFVQSPDGEEQIARITSENSPLFDDQIIDMAYDPSTGLMWIGSFKGLQSVKTETLGASKKSHGSQVYAYPNPVRPEYEGPIAIKGLIADANVKITDINGRLVYETTALGGQAIWDGKDYNGRKADTGVYLVFSSGGPAFGDPDSYVTKIMVVK